MSFVVIGLNHATTPLEVLEQVAVPADGLDKALHDLSTRPYVAEVVVLSTCNRTEIYLVAEKFHGAFQDVRDFLVQQSSVLPERLSDSLYTFYDDQAIEHLFGVSAGIDSAVLGEHEILGQVKRAWQSAQDHGTVGPRLNALFRSALAAGKRVRTDTGIGRNIASVSQAAIVLAKDRIGELADKRVLLVGAGEMGTGMALSVADATPSQITVMSRTDTTAHEIADRIDADVQPLGALANALVECDVAFFSTAAPSLVISADEMATVLQRRQGRPLLVLDVALPRDVDPTAANISGLDLCDLDTIGAFVAQGLESRAGELDAARAIVADEVRRHSDQVGERSVAPLITEFRAAVELVRAEELRRHESRLGELSVEQQAAVDEITRAVIAKVMHTPTVRLKDSATSVRGERLSAALRELFDLALGDDAAAEVDAEQTDVVADRLDP